MTLAHRHLFARKRLSFILWEALLSVTMKIKRIESAQVAYNRKGNTSRRKEQYRLGKKSKGEFKGLIIDVKA